MEIIPNFKLLPNKKTNETQKCYATEKEDNLFSQSTLPKIEITRQTETITDAFAPEVDALIDTSIKVSEDAQLLACCGAGSLSGIAFSASSKCFSVINGIRSTIASFSAEITAILNNSMLSDSEKNNKIKSITNKIKALINEANDKTCELRNITLMLRSMASTFITLEKLGKPTSSFLSELKNMVNNFNTKPTNLSDVSSLNDINDKIKTNEANRFGKDTTLELKENAQKSDEEIKKIEQKLKSKDITKDEKTALEKELLIHKSLKRVYELFI